MLSETRSYAVAFLMYLCNSALMLLVGWQEVIQPVKTEWWGVGVVICLERVAHLHNAYGPADATAMPKKSHHLLPHLNSD